MDLDKKLSGVHSLAIAGHIRPDGDCVGSCLAVYNYVVTYYPEVEAHIYLDPIPHIFDFLSRAQDIVPAPKETDAYDLFIALDCGDEGRLGPAFPIFQKAKDTVCVDHHVSNQSFAEENVIVPDASSTCELVYELLPKERITREIAECIYVGIIHDTGVFQYSCTSPRTMVIAGELMGRGIDFPRIVDETFFKKSFVQNQIMGQALINSRLFLDGRCVASVLTQKEMASYHAAPRHLEGIVSQLRVTKGVEVAVFLYENTDGTYKASLRASGDVNVAEIALKYGGGGHVKAAGATLSGKSPQEMVEELVADIEKQLQVPEQAS